MAANYVFEGGRFSFSKPVGQHMQLQHQIQLGKEPSYHFSPTYVGTLRQVSPQEVSVLLRCALASRRCRCLPVVVQTFPIIMADIDHKGSLMTQIIHEFSKSFRLRTQLQVAFPLEFKCLVAHYHVVDGGLGLQGRAGGGASLHVPAGAVLCRDMLATMAD
jgi:hypothetical protein